MKKRTKIAMTIMSLCLVITLGVIGIFAVKTLNMSVGGNVTFSADGILASISKGTMAGGSWVTSSDADAKMKAVEVTTNKTSAQLEAELASWQGLNFAFAQSGADVIITFTITNNSTKTNGYIDVKTSIDNGTAVNAYADVSPSWVVIDPGATQTFVVTLSVITTEINASLTNFVVDFELTQTDTKTQTSNLTFDVGEANNSANFPTTSYAVGTVVESLPTPNATNKTFEGWYTDAGLTQKVEFPFTITTDTKLYAKYVEATIEQSGYVYDAASDSYHVVRYRPEGYTFPEVVVVPDVYSGPYGTKPVTKIADGTGGSTTVFGMNDQIKELYIGNNITHLGSAVAAMATALEKVVIPDSVVSTGDYGFLFYGCSKLSDVTYSKNLKTVPACSFQGTAIENLDFIVGENTVVANQVFAQCNNFTELTIPQTIVSVGAFGFAKSANLTNVNMHSNLTLSNAVFWDTPYENSMKNQIISYYDQPDSKVLVKADISTISDTSQIPGYESITAISGSAFSNVNSEGSTQNNTTLKTVNFPNVTKVDGAAFYMCSGITSVNLPNATSVGTAAFYQCTAITSINLQNATSVGDASFYKCTGLTSVDLPKVEEVGNSAFNGCTKITTVSIPKAESIGDGSFNDCRELTTIDMSNVKYIGGVAFQYCYNLTINLHEGLLWIGDFGFNHCQNSKQTQIVIPSTLIQLGGREFVGDNEDNNIVGSHLFYNCATANITEFVVAEGNEHFTTHQGVLYTKTYRYMISYPSANTQTSYEMPEGCEEIFELCFSRPHFLKTLTIPNSFNIRAVSGDYAYNHPEMNNISNALYHYAAVDNVVIKSDNPNFKSIDGIVYSKDGTEVISVPTAYARGEKLEFASSCTTINAIPFFYALSTELTYNEQKVGKGPTEIVIGENIKTISQEALDAINSYKWTITNNSPYFTVNSEGKLARV